MSAHHTDHGRERPAFATGSEADVFLATLERFERGEISADEWRTFRLLNGSYPQRQGGELSMLRAKIPQGVLGREALHALALVAERFSRGFCHVTTRQNIQFHFVRLADVEPAMRLLGSAGVTNREACGNSVRNVTACTLAGVAADEVFDVTPYAEATTRYFLGHPLSSSLPRKFKIAFEGCPEDHAATGINDIGLRARLRQVEGRTERGFSVALGGGTATVPTSARVAVEFLPAGELLGFCEAVISVFHRLGERKNRKAARLKFLVKKLGWDGFVAELERELAAARARGLPALPFDPADPPAEGPPTGARPAPPSIDDVARRARSTPLRGPGIVPVVVTDPGGPAALAAWLRTNVAPQRQQGYVAVTATVPLGDLTSDQLRIVADLAAAYADGTVRLTLAQDLLFRWVPEGDAPELFARLAAAGLGKSGAGTVADVVSCPGAESCRLAVTASRGVAALVEEHLRARPELVAAARDLQIKVSGCPNGCGQHHVAGIGLQGSARKLGGRAVPQYFLLLGGAVEGGGARFGRLTAKIPARRVGEAVERLVRLYLAQRVAGESATAFFGRVTLDEARAALHPLAELAPETARPEDYVDLGEEQPFGAGAEGEQAA